MLKSWRNLILVIGLLFHGAAGAETEFYVRGAHTYLDEGVYWLDARIDYRFSDRSLEALDSGVALTVVLEIEVERQRAYLWDETVAEITQHYELTLHPLSGRYVVDNLNTGISRTFGTLEEAALFLGRLRRFPLLDAKLAPPGDDYEVVMKARLDIESLPAPLRPLAYLSSQWRLASDVFRCPLEE